MYFGCPDRIITSETILKCNIKKKCNILVLYSIGKYISWDPGAWKGAERAGPDNILTPAPDGVGAERAGPDNILTPAPDGVGVARPTRAKRIARRDSPRD